VTLVACGICTYRVDPITELRNVPAEIVAVMSIAPARVYDEPSGFVPDDVAMSHAPDARPSTVNSSSSALGVLGGSQIGSRVLYSELPIAANVVDFLANAAAESSISRISAGTSAVFAASPWISPAARFSCASFVTLPRPTLVAV
jgi:hypothetical protein